MVNQFQKVRFLKYYKILFLFMKMTLHVCYNTMYEKESGKPGIDKGDVHMMKRRIIYALSVLVLVVLLCAIIPAACAESCVCAPAKDKNPVCADGCGTDLELMRKSALSDFLMYTMAAEAEPDPAAQAALYREVVKSWDHYMDIVLQSLDEALAVKDSLPGEESMGIIGGADAPTDIYLLPETNGREDTFSASGYGQALSEDAYAEELKTPEEMLLEDFLIYMLAAEEEQDPAIQQRLYDQAAQSWEKYLKLLSSENMHSPVDGARRHGKNSPHSMYEPAAEEPAAVIQEQQEEDVYLTEPLFGPTEVPVISEHIGLPNPWTQTNSYDEAAKISGIRIHLPDDADLPQNMDLLYYRAVPGTLEVDYSDGNEDLMLRASLDDEGYVLSGDYNSYTHEWEQNFDGTTVSCLGDGARANVAVFKDGEIAFAVTMACGREGAGLTSDVLEKLAAAVLSEPEMPAAAKDVDIYADPVDIYADPKPVTELNEMEKPEVEKNGEIMVLYTGNVQCGIDEGFGYAGLKALRDSLEAQGYTTILADGGDAVQGTDIGTLSRGEAIIDFMNALDYDVAIPGDHETDYGDEQFLKLVRDADFPYISSNFTIGGELALEPYVILNADGKRIAFIGVSAGADSATAIGALQSAVDSARYEGAEIVYVISHTDEGLAAADLVGATTGIDVFFDNSTGGEPLILSDKAGQDVILVSCGAKLSGIGYSRINAAGYVVENGVWSWPNSTSAAMLFGVDNDVAEMVQSAYQKLAELSSDGEPDLYHTDEGKEMLDELMITLFA